MSPALLLALLTAQAASAAPAPTTASISTFRTQAEPRVDPVFGDVLSVRVAIDRFLALESEMEAVRNDFSTAVHDTLALLPSAQPAVLTSAGKPTRVATRTCPASVDASYARALAAGARFLQLGRRIETHHRAIKRADDLGDVQGLTPDYRAKAKRARELYTALVRDYREMRVAFYDQLGTELRFAGCRTALGPAGGVAAAKAESVDPANPAAWDLEGVDDEAAAPVAAATAPKPADKIEETAPGADSPIARAIWIDVDNARCPQASRIEIDGQPIGDIAAGHRTPVRTRAGPREVCLLPKADPRPCGAPGTLRRAYFYEGLTLTVVCPK